VTVAAAGDAGQRSNPAAAAMRRPKAFAVSMSPGTISSVEASAYVVVISPADDAT
jgi:hypothetical protein